LQNNNNQDEEGTPFFPKTEDQALDIRNTLSPNNQETIKTECCLNNENKINLNNFNNTINGDNNYINSKPNSIYKNNSKEKNYNN